MRRWPGEINVPREPSRRWVGENNILEEPRRRWLGENSVREEPKGAGRATTPNGAHSRWRSLGPIKAYPTQCLQYSRAQSRI